MMKGFDSPREFYVGRLTEGIATLGAAFYPKRVIVRLSDFKSNEYANLVGGERYEPHEENPMLGFRGAGRYVAESFRDCFVAGMRSGETRAQRYGPYQRRNHDPVRADGRPGESGHRRAGAARGLNAARTG